MIETLQDVEKVLDHGFVRLVDHMGGDARIVEAARVSYASNAKPNTPAEQTRLINYLLKNRHTSPFEQVVLVFHCKMPIFVARQWVRHRTARLNEVSARYTELPEEYYVPDPANVLAQSATNKQGRDGELSAEIAGMFAEDCSRAGHLDFNQYKRALVAGVARELARINLPLSTYTEWYWQIDLHNLFHFLGLRLDSHAQYEIRVYAEALYGFAKLVAPIACAAFEEHVLGAVTFSATEVKEMRKHFLAMVYEHPKELLDKIGWEK